MHLAFLCPIASNCLHSRIWPTHMELAGSNVQSFHFSCITPNHMRSNCTLVVHYESLRYVYSILSHRMLRMYRNCMNIFFLSCMKHLSYYLCLSKWAVKCFLNANDFKQIGQKCGSYGMIIAFKLLLRVSPLYWKIKKNYQARTVVKLALFLCKYCTVLYFIISAVSI